MAELPSLARVIWRGDGDLLSLVPAKAYRQPMCTLGQTRRSIVMVSDPVMVRRIMTEDMHRYPKSDLMQEALRPLVGDSIFVSGGATWERQRRMINPAFSHMKVSLAFNAMRDAVQDALPALDRSAAAGEQLSLDLLTSHLTADAITRTVFSMPLQSQTAHAVFASFITFERSVAQVQAALGSHSRLRVSARRGAGRSGRLLRQHERTFLTASGSRAQQEDEE